MEAEDIKKIAVLGAGVVGNSWVANFIWKGYPVNLWLYTGEEEESAKQSIEKHLEGLADNSIFRKEEIPQMLELVTYTTYIEDAVKDVEFIQEAMIEDLEVKQKYLTEIDTYAKPEAIYASSTSYLLISEIAKFSNLSKRCIGAHPFNPPHLIPLVEITIPEGNKGSVKSAEIAKEFYESIGKVPILLKKDVPGFVANQIQKAVSEKCSELLENEVCTVEDIDKAVSFGPGLRWATMGPYLIFQLGGGADGIKGLTLHIGKANLEDKSEEAVKELEVYADFIQGEVDKEMENRSPEFGRTNESLRMFRDKLLIKILKEHKKI
ncbi:MAG: 3-hydroxyacyl-CoA dehydrogenase family protein [Candidatus Lokiarchaeota archaeon]|nr:3-hydroxyacyl-CoA dehydrogenase family protein [Candidatus Lokiarchaeota archaeon]